MRIIKKTLDIHDFQKIKAMIFMTDGLHCLFLGRKLHGDFASVTATARRRCTQYRSE